jgi:hypothetical protein
MRTLCGRFQGESPTADVVLLLGPGQLPHVPYEVTATRLIELRNAGARPLLAFVPPGLKAAAEDSFDVSTFAEVPLADTGRQLRDRLYEQLPDALRVVVRAVVDFAPAPARATKTWPSTTRLCWPTTQPPRPWAGRSTGLA